VLLGDGAGALEPATNYAIPNTSWGLELADVNEDGRLDLATAALWAQSYVSLLLNSGGASIGSWTDIGYGLDGAAGSPVLSGQGSLVPSAPGVLLLTSAAPGAPGMLFVSMVSSPTAFKCGTLVPLPPLVRLGYATDSNGVAAWPWSDWPASLAGVDLFMQAFVADAAAVCGVSLINALWVVVP